MDNAYSEGQYLHAMDEKLHCVSTAAEVADPVVAEAVGADRAATLTWLYRYAPRTISPDAWLEVRPFVVSVLSGLPASIFTVQQSARILTKLAVWCLRE